MRESNIKLALFERETRFHKLQYEPVTFSFWYYPD